MGMAHFFNPQHDLALADGFPWYKAPRTALQFASDGAFLPLWYAQPGDAVLAPPPVDAWYQQQLDLFPQLASIAITTSVDDRRLLPWGWDNEVGARWHCLDQERTAVVRKLSDRIQTVQAARALGASYPVAEVLRTVQDAQTFAERQHDWVFKIPLSGSGAGVFMGHGALDVNTQGRVGRALHKFGYVMGEHQWQRVQDFAMEFVLGSEGCRFVGYSLFDTTATGNYVGNVLASDGMIEQCLSAYIPLQELHDVRDRLCTYFASYFVGYEGPIGVDMMVYRLGDGYALHPMVEINVRHTMGYVARCFYDNYVQQGAVGRFTVEHYPDAVAVQERLSIFRSPHVVDGRIVSGHTSLCPITADTRYLVVVEVN